MAAQFESPFVHLKKSQSGAPIPPSTPTNHVATKMDGSPHKQDVKTGDYQQRNDLHLEKKETRKRKKFCPVDNEISLHRHDMKEGASDVKVLTRVVNLKAVEVNPCTGLHMGGEGGGSDGGWNALGLPKQDYD